MNDAIKTYNYKDVLIKYSEEKDEIEVFINEVEISEFFKIFNESNYNVVNSLYVYPEFENICNKIFDTIKEILDKNEFILALRITNYLFNNFTVLWKYYLIHQRHTLGAKLWEHVCRITFNWESNNSFKIHKGTPFFFLGYTLLVQGNIDSAFLMIHNSMSEDIRFSEQIGDKNYYKTLPAYLFSSLNPYEKRNYLYQDVNQYCSVIKKYILNYNYTFSKNFSFEKFYESFLENDDIEDEKLFFVYCICCIFNLNVLSRKELENNYFSKLRNLDMIFNICLITDKIMKNKSKKENINGSVKFYAKDLFNISDETLEGLIEDIGFREKRENYNVEKAINTCLSLNYSYKETNIPKEVLTLLLTWGLRNCGGHEIEARDIFVEKYDDIIQSLMNSIFIFLENYY